MMSAVNQLAFEPVHCITPDVRVPVGEERPRSVGTLRDPDMIRIMIMIWIAIRITIGSMFGSISWIRTR